MKLMNGYRLQYWLYAVLNKQYGRTVTMRRDSLHARYDVNRHGFSIHGKHDAKLVFTFMTKQLVDAGFVHEPGRQVHEQSRMIKVIETAGIRQTIYVSLHISRWNDTVDSRKTIPTVSVWSGVYKSKVA